MSAIHHVPGRLRIRLSGLKGNRDKAHSIQLELTVLAGVTDAESNLRTGSVIVRYDPKLTNVGAVLSALDLEGLSPTFANTPVRNPVNDQKRIAQQAALAVLSVFAEKALERSVPILLAALL